MANPPVPPRHPTQSPVTNRKSSMRLIPSTPAGCLAATAGVVVVGGLVYFGYQYLTGDDEFTLPVTALTSPAPTPTPVDTDFALPENCAEAGAAELVGGLGAGAHRLDPVQDQTFVVDGEHLGNRRPAGLLEPTQRIGLAAEELRGRLGPRLDDGIAAVGHPQAGGGTDVTAGHRRGGHDTGFQQRLSARRGACHPCHDPDITGP